MAGHSKWANIKHRKGAADKKKSKEFGKLAKEIMIAARESGGDANANPRLRQALIAARAINLPKDNIDRAIKKGIGETGGAAFEEIVYEGYAAGGIAVMVECLTDNRNRSLSEVRFVFDRNGGNLAASGAVVRMFQRKTRVVIEGQGDEDFFMELALEAGADDVETDEGVTTILGGTECFEPLMKALEEKGITTLEAGISQIAELTTEIAELDKAQSVLKLVEKMEDLDDVQSVYTNMEVADSIADQLDDE